MVVVIIQAPIIRFSGFLKKTTFPVPLGFGLQDTCH